MTDILDYWEARLENWALWEVSESRVGISAYDGEWGDGAPRQPPPLIGEALDTDRLLHAMHAQGASGRELYVTVRARYCWTGLEATKASALGIAYPTYIRRIQQAKFRLDDLYNAWRPRRALSTAGFLITGGKINACTVQ